MGRLIDSFKAYIPDDATADATTLAIGKTGYVNGGKVTGTGVYSPAMMTYNGTAYSGKSGWSTSGNKITMVARFQKGAFTTTNASIMRSKAGAISYTRMYLLLVQDDFATADEQGRLRMQVNDNAGTLICYLVSNTVLNDDLPHTVFASFDGDTGAATFIVDGQDEDNVSATNRVAPTTGTLGTSSPLMSVGSADDNSSVNPFTDGSVGFCGTIDAYLTNWNDFMHPNGRPKALDESTWTEWGAQPLFWNEHGDMLDNKGSAGNMSRNGTITVGKGGNLV